MRVWLLVAPLVVAGCVNMTQSGNYSPHDRGTALSFYACEQLNSSDYAGTNYGLVRSCMENRGYRLESAGYIVTTIEVVTLPIWFPLDLITGGRFSNNMAVGDGPSVTE